MDASAAIKVRRQLNTLAPISRLPTEVLLHIIVLARGEFCASAGCRDETSDKLIRLTHVCSFWRTAALAQASLWSNVVVCIWKWDQLEEWIRRSRNAPLNVSYHCHWLWAMDSDNWGEIIEDPTASEILTLILKEASRIRYLDVTLPDVMLNAAEWPNAESFHRLDFLKIVALPSTKRAECEFEGFPAKDIITSTHVSTLYLHGYSNPWSPSLFPPFLTNLDLRIGPWSLGFEGLTWSTICTELRRLPLLESLTLVDVLTSLPRQVAEEDCHAIHLPRLRDLCIKDISIAIRRFLEGLETPTQHLRHKTVVVRDCFWNEENNVSPADDACQLLLALRKFFALPLDTERELNSSSPILPRSLVHSVRFTSGDGAPEIECWRDLLNEDDIINTHPQADLVFGAEEGYWCTPLKTDDNPLGIEAMSVALVLDVLDLQSVTQLSLQGPVMDKYGRSSTLR